jgi:hypothetical protein
MPHAKAKRKRVLARLVAERISESMLWRRESADGRRGNRAICEFFKVNPPQTSAARRHALIVWPMPERVFAHSPHDEVFSVVVSPSFDRDGTIFAIRV